MNDDLKNVLEKSNSLLESVVKMAEGTGGTNLPIQGQATVFDPTRFDRLGTYTPLVMDFMRNPAKPMYQSVMEFSYLVPSAVADGNRQELECPVVIGTSKYKTQMTFGKLWYAKDYSIEELMEKYNQSYLANATFESDNTFAGPIEEANLELLSNLALDVESKLWNGTIPVGGKRGIVGLKTQHQKVNTDTADTGRYNTTTFANNATGQNAFCSDIAARMNALKYIGASHFTLYIPNGNWGVFSQAWDAYSNIATMVRYLTANPNTGVSVNDGGRTSVFSDNGRHYVNERLDVVELDQMAASEAYLYPDTVNGKWQYQEYQFATAGKALPGIQTLISTSNGTASAELVGLTAESIASFLTNDARCDAVQLSKQWRGMFQATSVGLATLYSVVNFFIAPPTLNVKDKNSGVKNITA